MKGVHITNDIYYVGVNDRKKHLFENNWPLPHGVSYNSYLVKDKKSALIDTIEYGSNDNYLNTIEALLEGAPLDYLVVNHMEPDHSSMIECVMRRFPQVKVIGNAQTKKILSLYFNVPDDSFILVKDGETIDLGEKKLSFHLVPWVHWPETMVTYVMHLEGSALWTEASLMMRMTLRRITRERCSATTQTLLASTATWCRKQ